MNHQPAMNPSITNFSQCHVGIVEHLRTLGELSALLAPAQRARQIAADTLAFFEQVVCEHHAEEERVLFPAVSGSATAGDERDTVKTIVQRLTAEHRQLEALWAGIKSGLKQVARGHDATVDEAAVAQLVSDYQAHARFEEEVFLPLSQAILARNSNHMEALGLSLHMRHVRPVTPYI